MRFNGDGAKLGDDDLTPGGIFWGEYSGVQLDTAGATEARREEILEVHKHEVYKKVPLAVCYEVTGKRPIGVRWIDANKGDTLHHELRFRIVAKEIKQDHRLDLFLVTPPLGP